MADTDIIYDFDCGHSADGFVMTTRIRRACPICREGAAKNIRKVCVVCGKTMVLPLRLNRQKYCDDCRRNYNRACSIVNKHTNRGYTPASEIDVNEVMEGRDDPARDPLDIVFKKYELDPFYQPPREAHHGVAVQDMRACG